MQMNNKLLIRFFFFLPFLFPLFTTEAQHLSKTTDDDNSKYTNVGNIAITVSNFGVFGNGLNDWPTTGFRQPSMEYPRGSGIEHLFIGGLWVGAMTVNGIHVTTGAVDVSSIAPGKQYQGFEFTTGVNSIVIEKSTLPDSRFYDPSAISHQDFIADFTDTNTINPANNQTIFNHSPMGINVHMETYAFNYSFADNFVIFNYWIKNISGNSLDSVYVGLYADLVVRDWNLTPSTVGTPYYNKGGLGYVDTLNLAYAYDFDGDGGAADSYGGIKFLGSSPYKNATLYQSWLYNNSTDATFFSPLTDDVKYSKMATALLPAQLNALFGIGGDGKPSNNMTLLTVGPFSHIAAGDSVNVVFALLAAKMQTWGPPDPDNLTYYPHNRDKLYQTCTLGTKNV